MVGLPDCRTAADWNRARRDKLQTVPDLYAERIKQVQPFSTPPARQARPVTLTARGTYQGRTIDWTRTYGNNSEATPKRAVSYF
ncbi:hypothetical protein EAO71_25770 [Streptomyces sp. ms191]|nr:hypothetical protein EAO71_25770 [Streptomyces sp. ms191]